MNEAGFTLTETLAAMLILGLATGGMLTAMHAIGVQQERTGVRLADTSVRRAAETRLSRLLQAGGAFRAQDPDRLDGTKSEFRFACDAPAPCSVTLEEGAKGLELVVFQGDGSPRRLPLRREGPAQFEYVGALSRGDVWPPGGVERQSLRAITLSRGSGRERELLLQARIWREQPTRCAFDVIMQDCR